ncbi:hypothetical protein MBLNU457_3977t2 [Dothideomycetes sp. NU457]
MKKPSNMPNGDEMNGDINLSILNPFPTALDGPNTLHNLVAGRNTAGTALSHLDADDKVTNLSYHQLHSLSDALAAELLEHLEDSPLDQPRIIPIYLPQCPSLYISQLAILKAGAAFCPLNLDVPEDRLKFILQDVSAKVIVTLPDFKDKLMGMQDLPVLTVDLVKLSKKEGKASLSNIQVKTSDLAYIMYTSGSTGTPKAVCLSHRAVTQALLAHDRHIPQFVRFLQFASPTFDVSVFEIFFPLFRARTVVSCDRTVLLRDLPAAMTRLDVDAAELTPSVTASLVRARSNVPKLKTLLTIGEMLNVQTVREFGGSSDQPSALHGMYGPTEAAIHCTLQPHFQNNQAVNTIGIPLDTVSCFIVKPANSPEDAGNIEILSIGEIGELAVGGTQLADGYLNREEQTRAAFVHHPKYGPLYRTGDKAKLLDNGILECFGRISKGQVKLRGQRVELGEVEHAASQLNEVRAAAASVISGQLILFCIADSRSLSTQQVRDACKKWLPSFMIPGDIVLLDDFPYLPSGKTDQRKLEADYEARTDLEDEDDEPVSESTRKILDILQTALGLCLKPSSDLSSAGVDSLRSIALAAEFRKHGFSQVSAIDLLSASTVQDLEARIAESNQHSPSARDISSLVQTQMKNLRTAVMNDDQLLAHRSDIEDIFPCTPLQDAMLVETMRNPRAYCNQVLLRLPPRTSWSAAKQAFENVIRTHAALRSGFVQTSENVSVFAQIVWSPCVGIHYSEVKDFQQEFTIDSQASLLHPLRVQYRSDGTSSDLMIHMHHALYDQWSLDILVDDLSASLARVPLNPAPSFKEVAKQFAHLKNDSEAQASSKEFWQEYLAGASPTQLPNLTGKSAAPRPLQVVDQTMCLDMTEIEEAARTVGCSGHVLFQAAFAYLLSAYTGNEDLTFGTVYSGRTLPVDGVQDIFGPLLSTLPNRINLSDPRQYGDLVRALHSSNRDIMAHTNLSLADIKRACDLKTSDILFDSIFVWQATARDKDPEAAVELLSTRDYLEFNLTLELEPREHTVCAKATFQPSVIPAQQVILLLQQIERLVSWSIKNHNSVVDDITDAFDISVGSIANPDPKWHNFSAGLGSLVEVMAELRPHEPALCFATNITETSIDTRVLTYAEFNAKANKLAHHLEAQGVKPGDLVCVFMEKSVDLYISVLAVVKAGAGYLPQVPETPPQRLQTILTEARIECCLTDRESYSTLVPMKIVQNICVTDCDLTHYRSSNPKVTYNPKGLAYAVYTSGTTGKPKGVLVTNENIRSNIEVLKSIYPVPAESRLLQACNQAFDVSVFEIFFTWATGMCLCSATKDILFRDLEHSIRQLQVSHLSLTPTVAALVNPENVPSVKFLVTAGEAVTHHVHQSWADRGLYQGYGPSETTNICTVSPAVKKDYAINNIGPVFENTSGFVLKPSKGFQVLPAGALGELCFGGQQVFRGYQNMPELTSEKIIDHPDYGRIYRSGDLGRLLPSGNIAIQGRIDDQRKLRGQRIELGEIASCILQVPELHDCSIQILGQGSTERLVAFIIPMSAQSFDFIILRATQEVKHLLGSTQDKLVNALPTYMVPSILVPISRLPMTLQGKVDNRRLVAAFDGLTPEQLSTFSTAEDDPHDETELSEKEKIIASALAQTLQIPSASLRRSTSFFALGLDSLSAIKLSRSIKKSSGHQIDVSAILKRPSIARLALMLDESDSESSSNNVASPLDSFLEDDIKASILEDFAAHEAMLSASSDPRSPAYSNRMVFRLGADSAKIKDCWQEMVIRHDILRTAFCSTDSANHPFVQAVITEFDLPWIEMNHCPDPEELLNGSTESLPTPFDSYLPPYTLSSYQAQDAGYLVVDMHHALYDANAMSNLLGEIEQTLEGTKLSKPASFSSFLEHMLSGNPEDADRWFASHLSGLTLRSFNKRTGDDSKFSTVSRPLSIKKADVNAFLEKHTLSLLALTQAAWAKVLSVLQSCDDVCFGNVVSGRTVPVSDVEELVAPCFNTLPVRANLRKARSNIDLVKRLHQVNIDMLPFQLTSLRRVQQKIAAGQRLFDSLVLLQQPTKPLDSRVWTLEGETGEMNFPCIVEVVPCTDGFNLLLHLENSLLNAGSAPAFIADAFASAFVSCITYPLSSVSDLNDFDATKLDGTIQTSVIDMHNGKDGARSNDAEDWSTIETEIRDAFSDMSRVPANQISRHTTIYKMGLDSISAIQVANRLRKKGINVDASDILQNPTPSSLASVTQSKTHSPQRDSSVVDFAAFDAEHRDGIARSTSLSTEIEAIRPCTALQSGMLSQFLHSNGREYFNHMFYEMDEGLDENQLQVSWTRLMETHEMLRTGFASTEDVKRPFAMILYFVSSTSAEHQQLDTVTDVDFGKLEKEARDAVYDTLHLPTWRFRLLRYGHSNVMQLSMHHALYDAETLRLIITDLSTALQGRKLKQQPKIDSAISHIIKSSESDSEEKKAFWSEQLRGFSINRFPNLNPVVPEHATETLSLELHSQLTTSQLERRCKEAGVSVQAIGQVAWAKLLAAYTGEPLVTFGVVLSGRTFTETFDAAFPSINTVPAFCNVEETNGSLLEKFMSYNGALQKHAFTPLTDIQRYVGLTNEALFDTIFAYQKPTAGAVSQSPFSIVRESTQVDYGISIELEGELHDRFCLRLTFDNALLPSEQAKTLLEQLDRLLIDLTTLEEQRSASNKGFDNLAIVRAKDPIIPTDVPLLHQLVQQSISRYPDRVAMEFVTDLDEGKITSRQWTYSQLEDESNRVANLLRNLGAHPGDIVAMSFDKCPEAAFVFLGILKAGCAFLAIDASAPEARKRFILEDSKAKVLLTNSNVVAEMHHTESAAVVDVVSEIDGTISTSPPQDVVCSPDMVSYVLYTSGTTGTPKGCEITHENAVQAMLAFQRLFEGRWTEASRWLQFASYHFDVAVLEHFWTWSLGLRLVCAPRDLILEDLPGFIDSLEISHLDLTPSLGRLLDPELVPSLHSGVFITGGEAVKPEMLRAWGNYGCLFNFYGPTECTIGVTTFPSVPKNGKASNIGWQFDNVGVCVMKQDSDKVVLRGGVGELCIFGKLVGKGYLNRPGLNQERFPYAKSIDERIYRTGDLVRLLHDNSIDFLGRADSQVKLRGQRLEIDEIVAVILKNEIIKDAACVISKSKQQQKDQLVGFIADSSDRKQKIPELLPAKDSAAMIESARTACEQHLPGYMVPTHFIPVKCMPLSINNKLEEKQLKELFRTMSSSQIQEYAAQAQDSRPLNEVERKVAKALGAVLQVDATNAQPGSNIFTFGLSSISAIHFSRKLKAVGLEGAPIAVIMQNPTIGRLAQATSHGDRSEPGEVTAAKQTITGCQQKHMTTAAKVLSCNPDEIEAIAPCTPLQQGIIYRSVSSEHGLYFNSFRYKLREVDVEQLHRAFGLLVDQVQILRTAFVETEDGYIQVVKRKAAVPWTHVVPTKGQTTDELLQHHKRSWIASNESGITHPLDVMVVDDPSETVMQVNIHHAIYDGISWELLVDRLTKLYQKAEVRQPDLSFFDVLPHGPLRKMQGAKDFWIKQLASTAFSPMAETNENTAGADTLLSTSIDHVQLLEDIRKQLGVTLQAIVQAAWVITLSKYHIGPVGMVVSGRSLDVDAQEVIGPLFNTIPFAWQVDGRATWTSLIQQCHEFNTAALPFQHTPLRDISKWLGRSPSEPLFETLFVFQQAAVDNEQTLLVPVEDQGFVTDYPVAFEAELVGDQSLKISVGAAKTVFTAEQVNTVLGEFVDVVSTMTSDVDSTIVKSVGREIETPRGGGPIREAVDLNGIAGFEWTPQAEIIRAELAAVADIDEEEIDEHMSIFSIGADSIDAVKLSARLRKRGINIPVSAIMRSQTIPRMLRSVKSSSTTYEETKQILPELEKRVRAAVQKLYINPNRIQRVLPASPMQEALVAEMIKTDHNAYLNHDVLRLEADVNIERLEKAWDTVIRDSPILRTAFVELDDPEVDVTFAQVILRPTQARFEHIELESEDTFEQHMENVRQQIVHADRLDVPFRLTLATKGEDTYIILSIAHALYDGFSLGLLHEDVNAAYHGDFERRPGYDEILERSMRATSKEAGQFWQGLLSESSSTMIPVMPQPDSRTVREELASRISAQKISAFCRKKGVTVQSLCQMAWSLVLARYVQSLDVLYGLVLAGRDTADSDQIMFPTMNTVIMRLILHGTRQEMLQYTQAKIADIMPYQQTPLRRIQAAARVRGKNSQDVETALFNSLFIFQKQSGGDQPERKSLYESVGGASDVEYPLAVEAEVVENHLIWRTAYKSNVEAGQDVLQQIDEVLRAVVDEPASPVLSFTAGGVSICDQPAFKQDQSEDNGARISERDDVVNGASDPWNEEELAIRAVLAKVARIPEEEISKSARLQNLGIDSISAIKLSSLLRKQGIKLGVSDLIKAGSVSGILAAKQGLQEHAITADGPSSNAAADAISRKQLTASQFGIKDADLESILPATAGQVYMLNTWIAAAGAIFYPEFKYTVKGVSSVDQINRAWNLLVEKHAILRTKFAATDDAEVPFVQLVLKNCPPSTSLDGVGSQWTTQPFAHLRVKQIDNSFELGLKIHHALYDAVSLPLLMKDMEKMLVAEDDGTAAPSFGGYVSLGSSQKSMSRAKDFWTRYLSGTRPSRLAAIPSGDFSRVEIFDPNVIELRSKSDAQLRKQGINIQSLLFASYAKTYAELSNAKQDVVIGIYLANRSHAEDLSDLRAPTLNLLPLRVRQPLTTPLSDLTKQIQDDLEQISQAPNAQVGLWQIYEWTGVKVDTFVNFIKLPDSDEDADQIDDGKRAVSIDEVDNGRQTQARALVHKAVDTASFRISEELKGNVTKDAYLPSLDVEAVVKDGKLAVGVFGYERMVDLEGGKNIVQNIGKELRGFFKG